VLYHDSVLEMMILRSECWAEYMQAEADFLRTTRYKEIVLNSPVTLPLLYRTQ